MDDFDLRISASEDHALKTMATRQGLSLNGLLNRVVRAHVLGTPMPRPE